MQQQLSCAEGKWVDFVASDGYALFIKRCNELGNKVSILYFISCLINAVNHVTFINNVFNDFPFVHAYIACFNSFYLVALSPSS